jgi:hypothetical protein
MQIYLLSFREEKTESLLIFPVTGIINKNYQGTPGIGLVSRGNSQGIVIDESVNGIDCVTNYHPKTPRAQMLRRDPEIRRDSHTVRQTAVVRSLRKHRSQSIEIRHSTLVTEPDQEWGIRNLIGREIVDGEAQDWGYA